MWSEIEKLLRNADAVVRTPMVSSLAQRVREAKAKRDARRRYVAAVAVVILLASALSGLFESKNQKLVDASRVRIEIAQLEDEAKVRIDLVDRLLEAEREQKRVMSRRKFAAPPSESEIDRAAFAMVYQADRMAKNPALRNAAIEVYRDVRNDFPQSASAQVAKHRLEMMVERKDG